MTDPLVILTNNTLDPDDPCCLCLVREPIADDGFPVCRPCVLRIGEIAGDPCLALVSELAMLAEVHADVVAIASSIRRGMYWRWTSFWPDVGNHDLLDPTDERIRRRLRDIGA